MSEDRNGGGAKLRPPVKLPAAVGTFLFAEVGVEPGRAGPPWRSQSVVRQQAWLQVLLLRTGMWPRMC